MSDRLLLRGGTVLTMADEQPPRVADVLVVDGRIAAIGPSLSADAEVLDVAGQIVMPGFVDGHRHAWQTQLRGIAHGWSLKDYVRAVRMQAGPQYAPEDMAIGNRAAMLDALDAGVTTVMDVCHNVPTAEHAEAALEGTFAAGIRSLFSFGLAGNYGVGGEFGLEQRCAFVRDLRARRFASEDGLVRLGLHASDMIAEGPEQLIAEVRAARDLDLPISIHALYLRIAGFRGAGLRSEVEVLETAGLLDERIVWIHMNQATQHECDRVVGTGGAIVCTPEAEIQMGMGFPAFARTLEAGGLPALGVDVISSNSGCLLGQLRLALQIERMLANERTLDAEGATPEEIRPTTWQALRAATVGGAEAAGLGHRIGTLEVGKLADVITIDAGAINLLPVNDVVGSVALHAHPGNVANVLVGGVPRKRDGALVDDLAVVRRRVADSNARMFERIERSGGMIAQPRVPLAF